MSLDFHRGGKGSVKSGGICSLREESLNSATTRIAAILKGKSRETQWGFPTKSPTFSVGKSTEILSGSRQEYPWSWSVQREEGNYPTGIWAPSLPYWRMELKKLLIVLPKAFQLWIKINKQSKWETLDGGEEWSWLSERTYSQKKCSNFDFRKIQTGYWWVPLVLHMSICTFFGLSINPLFTLHSMPSSNLVWNLVLGQALDRALWWEAKGGIWFGLSFWSRATSHCTSVLIWLLLPHQCPSVLSSIMPLPGNHSPLRHPGVWVITVPVWQVKKLFPKGIRPNSLEPVTIHLYDPEMQLFQDL